MNENGKRLLWDMANWERMRAVDWMLADLDRIADVAVAVGIAEEEYRRDPLTATIEHLGRTELDKVSSRMREAVQNAKVMIG